MITDTRPPMRVALILFFRLCRHIVRVRKRQGGQREQKPFAVRQRQLLNKQGGAGQKQGGSKRIDNSHGAYVQHGCQLKLQGKKRSVIMLFFLGIRHMAKACVNIIQAFSKRLCVFPFRSGKRRTGGRGQLPGFLTEKGLVFFQTV